VLSGVKSGVNLIISVGSGSQSVHCALHFHTRFQEGQLKRQEGI
jgi:hypothetical protein